jgi:hypothetical protein
LGHAPGRDSGAGALIRFSASLGRLPHLAHLGSQPSLSMNCVGEQRDLGYEATLIALNVLVVPSGPVVFDASREPDDTVDLIAPVIPGETPEIT